MRALSAAVLVAAVVFPATSGHAAACQHAVVDPRDDVTAEHPDQSSLERSVDITAADVGTDARSLTAIVRVVDIDPEEGQTLPRTWYVHLGVGATRYELAAQGSAASATYELRRIEGDDGTSEAGAKTYATIHVAWVTGSIDPKADLVRIVAPRSLFGRGQVKGVLDGIYARALTDVSTPAQPPTPVGYYTVYPLQDATLGYGTYRVGAPYCRN